MNSLRFFLSITLTISLIAGSCQIKNNNDRTNQINEDVSVDYFEQKIKETPNAQLIDVRSAEEFNEGHLSNSINIDINSPTFISNIEKLNKEKPVFVYCLSGGRSGRAANKLSNMGFLEIYNLKGGILKWKAKEKPIVTNSNIPKALGMTLEDFNTAINKENYVLVDYFATWCAPCKIIGPMIEKIADERKDKLELIKIDADKNEALLKAKNIDAIPVLELYQNGKLIWRHSGLIEENELLRETGL